MILCSASLRSAAGAFRGHLRLPIALLCCLFNVSCGSFKPAEPEPDPYTIISRENPLPLRRMDASQYPADLQPLPMPIVDITDRPLEQATPFAPQALDVQPVEPVDVPDNQVQTTPKGSPNTSSDNSFSPKIAGGRLNVTLANGKSGHCSAQFVGDTEVILTAAHCVYDARFGGGTGTGWINDLEFVHSHGGTSPSPSFHDWSCVAIFKGWTLDDPRMDYAFVKLRSGIGRSLGLARSTFATTDATSIGYPSNINSNIMSYVNSDIISTNLYSGTLRHTPNPFGKGASGGAWVDTRYAESVNSFLNTANPNTMYGPILTQETLELFDFVKNDCSSVKLDTEATRAHRTPISDGFSGIVDVYAAQAFERTEQVEILDRAKEDGDSCRCSDALPIYAKNASAYPRKFLVGSKHFDEDGDRSSVVINEFELAANESVFLGCDVIYIEEGIDQSQNCRVKQNFEVVSDKRLRSSPDTADAELSEMGVVSADACTLNCYKNEPGWCLEVGNRMARALRPIATLSAASNRAPDQNSVVMTKSEVIETFQGDPDRVKDPCARSDIIKTQNQVLNNGESCIIESAGLFGDTDTELILQLHLPPELIAAKYSSDSLSFEAREKEPYLRLKGPDSEIYNNRYLGRLINFQQVGEDFIFTTENGCVRSADVP